jgi:hypothetical protein
MPKPKRSKPKKIKVRPVSRPVSEPEEAAPVIAAPAPVKEKPVAKSARALAVSSRYHYVITEIRRIGILAGVIVVILVVLALVW